MKNELVKASSYQRERFIRSLSDQQNHKQTRLSTFDIYSYS